MSRKRIRKPRTAKKKKLVVKNTTPPPIIFEEDPKPTPPTEQEEKSVWRSPTDLREGDEKALRQYLFQESPILEGLVEEAEVEAERLDTMRVIERETLSDLARDDRTWRGGGMAILGSNSANRARIQKQAYHLYYRDPLARNIIRALTYLTVSSGLRVKFPDDPSGKAAERWKVIATRTRWERRYRNIVALTYLLGEWFTVRLPLIGDKHWDKKSGRTDREKLLAALRKVPAEKVVLAGLSPLEINSIQMSEVNRESPEWYEMDDSANSQSGNLPTGKKRMPKKFHAADVSHFKIDDLEVDDRGHSVLEPVMRQIAYYRSFQLDRLTMTAIRTRIPLIRKIPGGPPRKAAVKAAMETQKLPRPGHIAITDLEEIWEHPGGPTDGNSAEKEGRAILLQICAGVQLPEFIVTADAANNNRASALVASAPVAAMIADRREGFEVEFTDMIEEAVGTRPALEFPSLIQEDLLNIVQAFSIMFRDKIVSRDTYGSRVGLNMAEETEKLEEDKDSTFTNLTDDQDLGNEGDELDGVEDSLERMTRGNSASIRQLNETLSRVTDLLQEMREERKREKWEAQIKPNRKR